MNILKSHSHTHYLVLVNRFWLSNKQTTTKKNIWWFLLNSNFLKIFVQSRTYYGEGYSGPCQTSVKELFYKLSLQLKAVNYFRKKLFIKDVSQGRKHASAVLPQILKTISSEYVCIVSATLRRDLSTVVLYSYIILLNSQVFRFKFC